MYRVSWTTKEHLEMLAVIYILREISMVVLVILSFSRILNTGMKCYVYFNASGTVARKIFESLFSAPYPTYVKDIEQYSNIHVSLFVDGIPIFGRVSISSIGKRALEKAVTSTSSKLELLSSTLGKTVLVRSDRKEI